MAGCAQYQEFGSHPVGLNDRLVEFQFINILLKVYSYRQDIHSKR